MSNSRKMKFNISIELDKIKEAVNAVVSQDVADNKNIAYLVSSYLLEKLGSLVNSFSPIISYKDFAEIEHFLDTFTPDAFLIGLSGGYFNEKDFEQEIKAVKNQIKGLYEVRKRQVIAGQISLIISIMATAISLAALFQ